MEAITEPRRTVIQDFSHLQGLLRDVAEERRISRDVIDSLAGWASGLAGKVFCAIPTKKLGTENTPRALHALGVRLVLEDDPEGLERISEFVGGRVEKFAITYKGSIKQKTAAYVEKVALRIIKRERRQWALRANQARNESLSPGHRRRIAKIAANARWQKHRRARKVASASALPVE